MKQWILGCGLSFCAAFSVSIASAETSGPEITHITPVSLSIHDIPPEDNRPKSGARRVSARTSAMAAEVLAERRAFAVQQAQSKRQRGQRVWCVPFARDISGLDLRGNAHTWWGKAAGRYERSNQPQIGAVMNFQATKGMPMGHVAVVSQIVNSRQIRIDHANWTRNRISLNMAVIDVSEKNDWSRVRLENGTERFGSVYPVYGFIMAAAR